MDLEGEGDAEEGEGWGLCSWAEEATEEGGKGGRVGVRYMALWCGGFGCELLSSGERPCVVVEMSSDQLRLQQTQDRFT